VWRGGAGAVLPRKAKTFDAAALEAGCSESTLPSAVPPRSCHGADAHCVWRGAAWPCQRRFCRLDFASCPKSAFTRFDPPKWLKGHLPRGGRECPRPAAAAAHAARWPTYGSSPWNRNQGQTHGALLLADSSRRRHRPGCLRPQPARDTARGEPPNSAAAARPQACSRRTVRR